MEYYFPEDINISFVAESSTAQINKQVTTSFTDSKKHLVQFDQRSKDTPDYLFFNIRGSATTSTSPEGYLVFYGVKEWMDSVPPEIYDHELETGMFEYEGGKMKMNMDLDLNGHLVIGAKDNFFQITGYYNKGSSLFGFLRFGKNRRQAEIPFGAYLIEVYSVITAGGVDNKFSIKLVNFSSSDSHTLNLHTTDNSKFQRFINFQQVLFRAANFGFTATVSYDANQRIHPKFTEAKFVFRFFRT